MAALNLTDVEAVMKACREWVAQHHRSGLTVSDWSRIRHALRERVRESGRPRPDELELVQLAHRLATAAADRRRDAAQRTEHARMARA